MSARRGLCLVVLSGCSGLFGIDFEQSVSGGAGGSNSGGSNSGGSNSGGSGGQGGIAECGPGAAFPTQGEVVITAFRELGATRVLVGWIAGGDMLTAGDADFSAPARSSFVLVLDQNNGLLERRHFTASSGLTFVDAATSSSTIFVLGNFSGTVDGVPGRSDGQDGVVLRLDSALQTQWVSRLHSTSGALTDEFTSLALAPTGEVIVGGGCGGPDGKVNGNDATKLDTGLGGATKWACHMALQAGDGTVNGSDLTTPLGKSLGASYNDLASSSSLGLRALVARNGKLDEFSLGAPATFTPQMLTSSASNVSLGPHFLTELNNQWFSLGNIQGNEFELGLFNPAPLRLSGALLNVHAFTSSFNELAIVGQLNGQLTAGAGNWPSPCDSETPSGVLALASYNNAFGPGSCLLINSDGVSALRGAIKTTDGWLVAGEANAPNNGQVTFGTASSTVSVPGTGSRLFVVQHCE